MKKIVCIIVILLNVQLGYAQKTDKTTEEIRAVIEELFDGYRAGDSTRVGSVFTKDAVIQTVHINTDGVSQITKPKPASIFTDYIGGGLTEVHDERLWETQIMSDKMLATVWTRYAFFLGEKFTHCGTETTAVNLRRSSHSRNRLARKASPRWAWLKSGGPAL